MATKNNKHAEDANGIEQINESLTSFSKKVETNKKKIGGIVAIVVIVALSVFGVIFWNNRNNAESAKKYSGIEAKAAQQAMKADPTAQDSVFNAIAIKELQALAKSDQGKAGGNLANLDLAARYYGDKKYNEAIACLKNADITEPVMKANATVLLADCYVNTKKYNEALSTLDQAIRDAVDNPEIAVRALLKKATILDSQKKYAEALTVYETIQKDYTQQANQISASGFNVEGYIAREQARLGK